MEAYKFKVVSFKVVDENDDGVYEPGEHVLVSDVIVQNQSKQVVPKDFGFRVGIMSTRWLKPISHDPIFLKTSLACGEEIKLDSTFRAFINLPVQWDDDLVHDFDKVYLNTVVIDAMGNSQMEIPDLSQPETIEIQYPIRLEDSPKFKSVLPGQDYEFIWTLRNISTKPFGSQRPLFKQRLQMSRYGSIQMKYKRGEDMLSFSGREPHLLSRSAIDVGFIEANSEVTISAIVSVSTTTPLYAETSGCHNPIYIPSPYTNSTMCFELVLSNPIPNPTSKKFSGANTVILSELNLQVSGSYVYHSDASFLLVINCTTRALYIKKFEDTIEKLGMKADIFNLSVDASLTDPQTGKHVLDQYAGKGILVFGDEFPIMVSSTEFKWVNAFNLLDPWLVRRLTWQGTNVHILNMNMNYNSRCKLWLRMANYPAGLTLPRDCPPYGSINSKSLEDLTKRLSSLEARGGLVHTIPRGFLDEPCMEDDAVLLVVVRALQLHLPHRKFVVTGVYPSTIMEFISITEVSAHIGTLSNCKKGICQSIEEIVQYSVIAAIPFQQRVRLHMDLTEIHMHKSAKNLPEDRKSNNKVTHDQSNKLLNFISSTIEYDLGREVYRFTSNNHDFKMIPDHLILQQLPLTCNYLEALESEPFASYSQPLLNRRLNSLVQIAAMLYPIVYTVNWNQTHLKFINKVRTLLSDALSDILKEQPIDIDVLKNEISKREEYNKDRMERNEPSTIYWYLRRCRDRKCRPCLDCLDRDTVSWGQKEVEERILEHEYFMAELNLLVESNHTAERLSSSPRYKEKPEKLT